MHTDTKVRSELRTSEEQPFEEFRGTEEFKGTGILPLEQKLLTPTLGSYQDSK